MVVVEFVFAVSVSRLPLAVHRHRLCCALLPAPARFCAVLFLFGFRADTRHKARAEHALVQASYLSSFRHAVTFRSPSDPDHRARATTGDPAATTHLPLSL